MFRKNNGRNKQLCVQRMQAHVGGAGGDAIFVVFEFVRSHVERKFEHRRRSSHWTTLFVLFNLDVRRSIGAKWSERFQRPSLQAGFRPTGWWSQKFRVRVLRGRVGRMGSVVSKVNHPTPIFPVSLSFCHVYNRTYCIQTR